MTIRDIIINGKGRAGAWRVVRGDARWARVPENTATLYHYSTAMLTWNVTDPADPDTLRTDLGWGSVSDQNGMNTAFRALNLPYYYSRKGGADIIDRHIGHYSRIGGTYWCDTCDSPYCELA